jgi:hypothetical protein
MFSRLEGAKHHRSPSRPGRKLIWSTWLFSNKANILELFTS